LRALFCFALCGNSSMPIFAAGISFKIKADATGLSAHIVRRGRRGAICAEFALFKAVLHERAVE